MNVPSGWVGPPSRDNRFDLLRAVLASIVVWSHGYTLLLRDGLDPLRRATGGLVYLGGSSVDGFFVMSGYLVCASWLRDPRPGAWLRRRASRVVPAFVVAFLFSVDVGLACLRGVAPRVDVFELLGRLVMLKGPRIPGAFPDNLFPGKVNGALWTIAPEVAHYLIFLGIARVGALRRSVVAAVLGVASVLYALDVSVELPWPMRDSPRFTCYFFAGIAFGFLGDRLRCGARPLLVAVLVLAAGALDARLYRFALPTAGAYLLLRAALGRRPRFDPTHAGDISYGLYVYSFPTQQALIHVLGTSLPPTTLFLLTMGFCVPFAAASWRFVERPFLRWGRPAGEEPRAVVATRPGEDEAGVGVTREGPLGSGAARSP
jgi:peptidoglycan/LPS O-acetylase OafA/YrhL